MILIAGCGVGSAGTRSDILRSGLATDIRTKRRPASAEVNVHETIGGKRNIKDFGELVHFERCFVETRATMH